LIKKKIIKEEVPFFGIVITNEIWYCSDCKIWSNSLFWLHEMNYTNSEKGIRSYTCPSCNSKYIEIVKIT